jgi:hypothetical protein
MPAVRGPDYQPLLPLGWHPMTLSELRRLCVDQFLLSATRPMLMAGLETIAGRLVTASIVGNLWVNGSFLTEKINPADTDVVLEVDAPSMYDNGSREQKDEIDWIIGNLKNTPLKCDCYPLFTYPIPHLLFQEGEWWRAYWIHQFGFSREVDPKGIVTISIPDGAQ